jgi:hypothetical protein
MLIIWEVIEIDHFKYISSVYSFLRWGLSGGEEILKRWLVVDNR